MVSGGILMAVGGCAGVDVVDGDGAIEGGVIVFEDYAWDVVNSAESLGDGAPYAVDSIVGERWGSNVKHEANEVSVENGMREEVFALAEVVRVHESERWEVGEKALGPLVVGWEDNVVGEDAIKALVGEALKGVVELTDGCGVRRANDVVG